MTDEAPLVQSISTSVALVAKGSDATFPVGVAPFAGTVTSVSFIPQAALTGAATNYRTHKLINVGAKGEGTTVVAEVAYKESSIKAEAFVPKVITLSEAKKLAVAAGDVLQWDSVHTGEGLADVAGKITVSISRS